MERATGRDRALGRGGLRRRRGLVAFAAVALGAAIACGVVLDWNGTYILVDGGLTHTLTLSGTAPAITIDEYSTDDGLGCKVAVYACAATVNNGTQTFAATACPVVQEPPGCDPAAPTSVAIDGTELTEVAEVVQSIEVIVDKISPPYVLVREAICSEDSDGDRLGDCVETNTGVFVDADDTGTNPFVADTDGDGIDDGDETLGTVDGLDLPGMGANPLRQTILFELDWFDDSLDCAAHSHRPNLTTHNMVVAAFAGAPVLNPDGTTGIDAILDRGQGGAFTGGNLVTDADGVLATGVNGQEFKDHKAANFAPEREGYFHYVLMPHRYNTDSSSSGQAELPGDDMIVSLYCAYSSANVAHTILHEVGHNLWLRHGGNTNCNYKPNYNSVMNYKYQFPGVDDDCTPPGDGVLNYSIGDRIDLDENALDENAGTCGDVAYDWDGNTLIENPVVFDVNSQDNASCGGTLSVLQDFDDWANADLATGLADADGAAPDDQPTTEIIECTNVPPMP